MPPEEDGAQQSAGKGPSQQDLGSWEPCGLARDAGEEWGGRSSLSHTAPPIPSFTGDVFYATSPEKFTFQEAGAECRRLGARLATTGQLYLAWQSGMDVCSAGWLADRSVRYPISKARPNCGGNLLGVRTVYVHANQTGYPDPSSRYDAICYTGGAGGLEGGLGGVMWKLGPRGGGLGFSPFKGPQGT